MESIQIFLNSSNADKLNNGSTSDCDFFLPIIEIPDGFHIYLSVVKCLIPYSFYTVNSTNNTFSYTLYGAGISNYSSTIPSGNYNVNQLFSALIPIIHPFFANSSYDSTTNKFTFTSTTTEFSLNYSTNSCLSLFGFNKTTTSTNKTLTSTNCANVNPVKCINVVSNLITYNINKSFINNQTILCCIPVNKPPLSLIEYTNQNNFRSNLFVNTISIIKLKLVDENNNIIDLNGLHWSITLQLDVEPFRE
jgi:hypothetical protein